MRTKHYYENVAVTTIQKAERLEDENNIIQQNIQSSKELALAQTKVVESPIAIEKADRFVCWRGKKTKQGQGRS